MIYWKKVLQNETSANEIMRDQCKNSDEDQIMQKNDFDYSSVRDRSRSPRERNTGERQEGQIILKMKQSLEVQDLLGA